MRNAAVPPSGALAAHVQTGLSGRGSSRPVCTSVRSLPESVSGYGPVPVPGGRRDHLVGGGPGPALRRCYVSPSAPGAGGCGAARAVCPAAVPLSRGGGGTCLGVRGPCARAALGRSAAVSESVWQDLGPSVSLSIVVAVVWLGRL